MRNAVHKSAPVWRPTGTSPCCPDQPLRTPLVGCRPSCCCHCVCAQRRHRPGLHTLQRQLVLQRRAEGAGWPPQGLLHAAAAPSLLLLLLLSVLPPLPRRLLQLLPLRQGCGVLQEGKDWRHWLLQVYKVSFRTIHAGGCPTVIIGAVPPASNNTKTGARSSYASAKSSRITRADTADHMLSVVSLTDRYNTHVCCSASKPCKHQTVPVHRLQALLSN
jgi:hypothetical protein